MNMVDDQLQLLLARWAIPVVGEPIENAAIVVRAGKIESIRKKEALGASYSDTVLKEMEKTAVDYGSAVILPGFINLHTHLEYSLLHGVYHDDEGTMFEWLPKLVTASWSWPPEKWIRSVLYGAEQSIAAGTTCIVDNSFTGQSVKLLAEIGVRAVVGLELFGQDETLAEAAWQRWLDKYEKVAGDADSKLQEALADGRIEITVAPHAPYTVAPALWQKASQWAQIHDRRVLGHVAESAEECSWIKSSDQTIDKYLRFVRELQAKAGIIAYNGLEPPPTPWRGKGQSPCGLLHEHNLLNNYLVATHAVQVDISDIELLAKNGVKIVHCPRSNVRLKHGLAPLNQFRANGLTVGLGTDSLASSPDLNMLHEARKTLELHAHQPADEGPHGMPFSMEEALKMITLQAASVIGLQQKIGSLEEGKLADLAIFSYEQAQWRSTPLETIFSENPTSVAVYVQGKRIEAGSSSRLKR